MDSKQYLTQAYAKYYNAFIKKAMSFFDNQKDKAFDCVQEVVLSLLKVNFPYESIEHACGIFNKRIEWEAYRMKHQRKKWGAFRERSCDFTNAVIQSRMHNEIPPNIKGSIDYWPQSNRYFKHINKLNSYHQQLIRLYMLGVGNTEAARMLKKGSKDYVGSSRIDAFKMLRNFRVANTLRDPLERSRLRQGSDDRTDKIMEMTAAGMPDKEIAGRLGLTIGNVRCRRFDRQKLLKKIKENNDNS